MKQKQENISKAFLQKQQAKERELRQQEIQKSQLDEDKDGLTYEQEIRLGTSDNQKDTDGDGIDDNEDEHPAGQNYTVAVLSYEGYNMDDAIIINKSSIQRGIGRSTFYRPYVGEELRYSGGLVDEICVPDKDVKGYRSEKDYRFLNEDGLAYIEAKVNPDDVLIGKTSPPRFLGKLRTFGTAASTKNDTSVRIRSGEDGIVSKVIITENEEGDRLITIKIRDTRKPEIGDKFASRHGQKGVVGRIVPREDLPFTASGVVPDVIFSPNSLPKRMTLGHIIEILAGKVGALNGRCGFKNPIPRKKGWSVSENF